MNFATSDTELKSLVTVSQTESDQAVCVWSVWRQSAPVCLLTGTDGQMGECLFAVLTVCFQHLWYSLECVRNHYRLDTRHGFTQVLLADAGESHTCLLITIHSFLLSFCMFLHSFMHSFLLSFVPSFFLYQSSWWFCVILIWIQIQAMMKLHHTVSDSDAKYSWFLSYCKY